MDGSTFLKISVSCPHGRVLGWGGVNTICHSEMAGFHILTHELTRVGRVKIRVV
jgi:hypothetical protein